MVLRRRRRSPLLSGRHLFVLVVVLVVSGWVTAQVAPQRDVAPVSSPQVYTEHSSSIRFSHSKHTDVACADCHAAATVSQRASDSLRPAMQACVGCHNAEPAAPNASECAACHVGYARRVDAEVSRPEQWRSVRPAPLVLPAQPPALRFNHAKHVGVMKGGCVSCHGASGKPVLPRMDSCTSCHQAAGAPNDCATCHPTGANGKLRATRQRIDEPLRPSNHDVSFLQRHGTVAKSRKAECMACHVEQDCADCHDATVARPFSVHPPGFLTVHAVDARAASGNCADCHDQQTFCASCHVRANVMGAPPHDPPALRRYHPPGWLEASQPNNHGVMARREITECATCHTEADCISCHAGVNPHPPDFVANCRRMLTANGSSCSKCHSDLNAIRALCL